MSFVREVTTLQSLCLNSIRRKPQLTMTDEKIQSAFYSENARRRFQRLPGSTSLAIKQRIIDEVITNGGRIKVGTLPIPPAFLDEGITSLSLAQSKIGPDFIAQVLGNRCPALRHLDLTGCFFITDEAMKILTQACSALQSLKLLNCRKITDDTLDHLVSYTHSLTALDLGGCYNVTPQGVARLLKSHTNRSRFEELNLSGLGLADAECASISQNCPRISKLGLGYLFVSESALLLLLAKYNRVLVLLRLHWCRHVTDESLRWMQGNLPKLETLDLCGCAAITEGGVRSLLETRLERGWKSPRNVTIKYAGIEKADVESMVRDLPHITFGT